MITMLGIPNCDTVKKARQFLERHGVAYRFRDIRAEPLGEQDWRALVGQDRTGRLVNLRSPSFRETGMAAAGLTPEIAVQVLIAKPTAMKRPVILDGDSLCSIGFTPEQFATYLE